MKIKSIRQAKSLAGKVVFLRADLNVPVKNGVIKDDYKITAVLPTLRYLLRHNSAVIIATHLGKGSKTETTKPIAERLALLLDKKVTYIDGWQGRKVLKAVDGIGNKDVIFLENLRHCPEEMKNDKKFARKLASLADIYVNDAFAVCHRDHASVSAIKKYLPAYAGLLLEKEIINLEKILKPARPMVAILGGAKIETKIDLINNLAKKSFRLLIGGALANNFIAAHGYEIGKSVADRPSIRTAAQIIGRHKNIVLPVDAVVAGDFKNQSPKVKPVSRISPDEMILDIGPRTVKLFANFIRQAATIIWNGPLGYFENERTKHGTLAIARFIAARSGGPAFGVAGGGETIEALNMTKMADYLDWVSTGGGAMLAFLGGETMPGLKGIVK